MSRRGHRRFTFTEASVKPEAERRATLAICARAIDAADARMLLEACGLLPYRRGDFPLYSYGRLRSAK